MFSRLFKAERESTNTYNTLVELSNQSRANNIATNSALIIQTVESLKNFLTPKSET